jgi:hypothetical protein
MQATAGSAGKRPETSSTKNVSTNPTTRVGSTTWFIMGIIFTATRG